MVFDRIINYIIVFQLFSVNKKGQKGRAELDSALPFIWCSFEISARGARRTHPRAHACGRQRRWYAVHRAGKPQPLP